VGQILVEFLTPAAEICSCLETIETC